MQKTFEQSELIHGDCIEELLKFKNEQFHLIVTSPPYFNAREYAQWPTYESYLEWCEDWIAQCLRTLKPGRMICINISSVIQARESRSKRSKRYNIPADLCHILQNQGFWFCEEIIWEKPEGAAINRNQRFSLDRHPMQWRANPTTERILVYQKPTDTLNDTIIRSYNGTDRIEGDFERGEVWKFNPETKSSHPAPFPLHLPQTLIRYYSWSGDIVLDLFGGSGTTMEAALGLGRKFVSIERNEDYHQMSIDRLERLLSSKDMFA